MEMRGEKNARRSQARNAFIWRSCMLGNKSDITGYKFDKGNCFIEIDVHIAESFGCVFLQKGSRAVCTKSKIPSEAINWICTCEYEPKDMNTCLFAKPRDYSQVEKAKDRLSSPCSRPENEKLFKQRYSSRRRLERQSKQEPGSSSKAKPRQEWAQFADSIVEDPPAPKGRKRNRRQLFVDAREILKEVEIKKELGYMKSNDKFVEKKKCVCNNWKKT